MILDKVKEDAINEVYHELQDTGVDIDIDIIKTVLGVTNVYYKQAMESKQPKVVIPYIGSFNYNHVKVKRLESKGVNADNDFPAIENAVSHFMQMSAEEKIELKKKQRALTNKWNKVKAAYKTSGTNRQDSD